MNEFDAPFPQANNFDKVLMVLNVEKPEKLKDYGFMTVYLEDITDRQVDYYISACTYLGLINKQKEFTDLGNRVRNKVGIEQASEIARILVSDEIIGYIYFQQKFLGTELDKDDIIEIMKEMIVFNSEAMYERRASTIISWLRWINKQEEDA